MCRKKTGSKNHQITKTNKEKILLLWKCTVSHSKKLRFIKNQEASGLWSSLGLRTTLSEILLLGDILF